MAFFSAVSSTIGRKLLLFGLRHIDILDKDPADFVSFDAGKKTTLEVRDAGLHVKKLVALLHLKLPPEIHLSKARALRFRVTFILEFGVPQIIIEIDGVQLHAKLAEDADPHSKSRGTERSSPRARSPTHRRQPSSASYSAVDMSDASSEEDDKDDEDDGHIPTVDELAKSFIREEPAAEIRELEQQLESQPALLDESVSSSDDGDDENTAGMGAPLALPAYLRNLLNSALDRLTITISSIDIEVEDHFPTEYSNSSKEDDDSPISLQFHVDRVAIDSVASEGPRVDVLTSSKPDDNSSKVGKRRMRVENICARLVSDAENFAAMSRISRPSSPATTRSDISTSHKTQSEQSASQTSATQSSLVQRGEVLPSEELPTLDLSATMDQSTESPSILRENLTSSVQTMDEDRFADVVSDDGLSRSTITEPLTSSPTHDLGGSSMLYNDEGLLDYAMQNDLLGSQAFDGDPTVSEGAHNSSMDGAGSSHQQDSSSPVDGISISDPLSFAGGQPHILPHSEQSLCSSIELEQLASSTDNLGKARHFAKENSSPEHSLRSSYHGHTQEEDLSESRMFSHDDAESMYMSAMSGASLETSRRPDIPGGWDSSSSASSQDTSSDTSAPVPESMIAGSILGPPAVEADDGCETPRPASPQSAFSSPRQTRQAPLGDTKTSYGGRDQPLPRLAKLFLSIDEVTAWFPLGLSEGQSSEATSAEATVEASGFDFQPTNIAEDSIFQGMPGSFSNYAHSNSSRRKASVEEAARIRPNLKSAQNEQTSAKKNPSSAVSIEVGTLLGHMDISTGRIMYRLFDRALRAFAGQEAHPETSVKGKEPLEQLAKSPSVDLFVKHVKIAWRERLLTESMVGNGPSRTILDIDPLDAILKINLSSIQAASRSTVEGRRARLQIGKFTLSSLEHEIIAFQSPRPRSRKSIEAPPNQLPNDVEINYEQANDRRVTVVTRPVKIVFDLQKLDEALSSFGGFSGVLELSASITSNNTAPSAPLSPPAQARSRGVRFGDIPPAPLQKAPSSMPKIQVQFGDVIFDLKGKSCTVQLRTTSVRLAVRESNVRLKVKQIHLSGPHLLQPHSGAPLIVNIEDSVVNFLFVPETVDLDKFIDIVTPSRDPYEDKDEIIVDNLLTQRRKGSVLRAEVGSIGVRLSDLAQMEAFEALGAEIAKLSKVTRYLPDDDRPGILTLAMVQHLNIETVINDRLGDIAISLHNTSIAHVGVPSLLAVEVGTLSVKRDEELLIHEVVKLRAQDQLPMVMLRVVGDEMEPVVKAKLFNLCAEYRVSTVMAALGISEDGTVDDIALGLASSVATITGATSQKTLSRQSSAASTPSTMANTKPLHLDVLLRNCALGLNPRKISAKGLFVLTDTRFLGKQSNQTAYSIEVELRKASIHAIDDIARLEDQENLGPSSSGPSTTGRHLAELSQLGYASLSSISAAKVLVTIAEGNDNEARLISVEFKNELFVLESCADSTQSLIAILNGLAPPTPPSTGEQYRNVVPLQNMMDLLSEDVVFAPESAADEEFMDNADFVADEVPNNLEFVGSFYNQGSLPTEEELGDSLLGEEDLEALAAPPITRQRGDRGLLESFQEQYEVAEGEEEFEFDDGYLKDSDSEHKGKARKWSSAKNEYHLTNDFKIPNAPLKVRVRDVNIVWNLYDGYDWPSTRNKLAQAIEDVENRAEERRRKPHDEDEDDDFVEQDFLFNSVWIGVPIKDEQGALARRIHHEIDDQASETGSYATSTATRSTGATVRPRSATKSARAHKRFRRSKHKNIGIQLMGVAVDFIVFPPDSGETISSVDIRVHDFEIFDSVPGSTWNKFLTCMIEKSQREMNRPMINLEVQTVRPIFDLTATELVIKVDILPLRLHVDQRALEFIQRFFEFKDASVSDSSTPPEQPYIQRLVVGAVRLKLDYKPVKLDYRGLRSGHTTELMNILVLEGSDIVLRRAFVPGLSFDQVQKTLNDVWMADVKRNQLPGVLKGIAAVSPLVNVASGVRDLIVVPMREYKKDGRIVRSLQKGVFAFATKTTSEAARLTAKVAIGAQNVLEGTEKFLNPEQASPGRSSSAHHHDWDGEDPSSSDSEEPRAVSNYAHQPIGVRAGIRNAIRAAQQDFSIARDTMITIPTEIMHVGTGAGALGVLGRRAPTVILRPLQGASKVISNAMLGAGNALDPQSQRKIGDKYKSY